MAKDPAFLFYSQDWIVGTSFMSMEERGQYITLLAAIHQHGRLSPERVGFLLGLPWVSVSEVLRSKFKTDENGLLYNDRLEQEIEKRSQYIDKQRANGLKGGRPKTQPITQTKPKHKAKPKPKKNPTENENEDENESVNKGIVLVQNPFGPNGDELWRRWLAYKKDEHGERYKSVETECAALKNLYKLSNGDLSTATEIVERSIANRWKGLFKIENNGSEKLGTSAARIQAAADF